MERQNLSTKAGRKAWKHDLRMVAVRPRRIGLVLTASAMLLALLPIADVHSLFGYSPRFLAICLLTLATPLLIAATVLRRRYLRSLSNEDGAHGGR